MINSHLIPIVDADYIVYRVGFAVGPEEPVEYALATVKSSINNIWDRFRDSPEQGKLYIGGANNFREKVATHRIYKGNRDTSLRPNFYSEIRDYMVHIHGAIKVDGMEAEDAAGIEHYKHKDKSTVLVHQDKDLNCLPGWHYNPIKDVLYYQTMRDANTHFWTQVLTGDSTDNIRGIDGIGPKTAANLLAPCDGDWMKMYEVALSKYKKQHGLEGESMLRETCMLVWILRKEGETFDGSAIEKEEQE